MDQQTVVRRRVLESICREMGRKMPTWSELARRAVDDLEQELRIDCEERGVDFNELVAESDPRTMPHDRRIRKDQIGSYLDEGE